MKKAAPPELRYVVHIGPKEELGTRAPMVRVLTDRMELFRKRESAKWIGNPQKTRLKRAQLLKLLSYNPPPVPLRPRLLREEKFPAYLRRTYRLQINPDDQTEAFLYLPRDASQKKPAPALVGIHEHGGQFVLGKVKLCHIEGMPRAFRNYQEMCYSGQPPADFFAANGFAIVVIDQLGFGGRGLWRNGEKPYHNARLPITSAADMQFRLRMRYEQFWLHRALLANGVTEAEISLYDNRRSIDFLESIPEIDSRRIGAFGLSVGSMQCHQLAAFDPRVKASVRVCWSGDMGEMIKRDGPRVLGVQFLLPGVNAECHVPELVALSYPNAALIINGKRDTMYSLANQEKTRRETLCLAKLQGRGDKVRWIFFDGPHCFHPPQQRQALQFFQQFLV